ALAMLGPRDRVLRTRALGILAGELLYNPATLTRAHTLSEEALAVARRIGDPGALADALVSWYSGSWQPDNLEARLAAANPLSALGDTQDSLEMKAQACVLRARCLFGLGGIAPAA